MAKTLADMTTEERAVKVLNDVGEYIDHLEACTAYVTALEAAGLLMPDLPKPHEVEFPGFATFNLPGAGCSIPLDDYAPQVMVIFGDEECSDATAGAGARLTAIKPEDLDKLIACLLAAREYAEKEHDNE